MLFCSPFCRRRHRRCCRLHILLPPACLLPPSVSWHFWPWASLPDAVDTSSYNFTAAVACPRFSPLPLAATFFNILQYLPRFLFVVFSCVACCVSTSSSEQRQQQVSHEVDQKRQANVANSCAVVGISLVPLSFAFFGQTSLLSYVKCAKCFSRHCSHALHCSTLS